MEFPDLGDNCAMKTCRTLDFLPVRCSGCQKLFCKDHYCYDCHACPVARTRERQVPICPLCGVPVPTAPHESADTNVGRHIDSACQSKPALSLKGKIFNNACSMPKCKRKELVPVCCERCHLNFCIGHRNELDHNCQGPQHQNSGGRRISSAGIAAIKRAITRQKSKNNSVGCGRLDAVSGTQSKALQEEEDRQFALALAASFAAEEQNEAVVSRQRQRTTLNSNTSRDQNNCSLS